MIVLNYLFSIILPLMVGISLYILINKRRDWIKSILVTPFFFLLSNLICYLITIYIFKESAFNLTTGGNILILKYSILNVVVTTLLVTIIIFCEKTLEITLGVENEEG